MQQYYKSLRIKDTIHKLLKRLPTKKVVVFLQKRPFTSFFIALGALFVLIFLSSIIANLSKKETVQPPLLKSVKIYQIGSSPKVALQGKVEKKAVTKITAQTAGIVSTIHVVEGGHVKAGDWIVSLSSNYQGGDAFALQRQLAESLYNNVKDTYDIQKDLIQKERDISNKSSDNTEELRKISQTSLDDTRSLINLNQDIFSSIDTNLTSLQNNNVGGANDALILQTKQLKSQFQSAILQLGAQARSLDYQTNTDNPPTDLTNLQKDLTNRQLDLQQKALDLSRETSKIQLNLAYVNESLMHPASPFAGVVDRVFVKEGQSVTPGTPIASITGNTDDPKVIAQAPRSIARIVSKVEPSTLHIGRRVYTLTPTYTSENATDGQLYSIIYNLPPSFDGKVTDSEYLVIDVPLSVQNTSSTVPYLPIDTVYQTQDESLVYVIKNGTAEARKIILGDVYGQYVEVLGGLKNGDQVILSRSVVAGDKVKASYE